MIQRINNSAASERSMKQPLFSTSYAPRDGESTLGEIESENSVEVMGYEVVIDLDASITPNENYEDELSDWQQAASIAQASLNQAA